MGDDFIISPCEKVITIVTDRCWKHDYTSSDPIYCLENDFDLLWVDHPFGINDELSVLLDCEVRDGHLSILQGNEVDDDPCELLLEDSAEIVQLWDQIFRSRDDDEFQRDIHAVSNTI